MKKKAYVVNDIRKIHNNAYRKWTNQEDKKLKRLLLEGKTIQDLSNIFQRNSGAINSRIEKLNINKFKNNKIDKKMIQIITSKTFPVKYKNPKLKYQSCSNFLQTIITESSTIIAEGYILDFYKNFTNTNDETSCYFGGDKKKEFTEFGLLINNKKYLNNDLSKEEMDERAIKVGELFKKIIFENFKLLKNETTLTFIPSSSEIPDKTCDFLNKQLPKFNKENLIKVNKSIGSAKDLNSKSEKKIFNFLEQKYKINSPKLKNQNCLIIDDVFGTGNSITFVAKKLKQYFNQIYFLCICKDVKR